jgi:alpha-glucosidase
MASDYRWWQRGVIYQVYPRSFQDSNGDGIGDLPGVIERLGYLSWLGVDAIWLSPIFPSPMADFGYDVSDYTGIDAAFGTLDDFDRLVREAHARGIKVLLDFVPNHTSDRHPWFLESRSSRENPRRDWYIWSDAGPGGTVPNNWLSNFGGSAWTWDPDTGQYYYHAFLREQPDLNWRNLEVREAMFAVLRFWLDRGVDGFRVDVIWGIVKDDLLRDNPPNPDYHASLPPHYQQLSTYSTDRPEVHEIIRGMRGVLDAYDDRMMVGEIYLPIERLVTYYGSGGDEVHLPFNFQLIRLPWHARVVADTIARYEALLPEGGWPNWVLGNHDRPRIATRVGAGQARVAAMLLLTLRGTPTLYYGDEIGMVNVAIPPDAVQDPLERNVPGLGFGRDPERTPMQWSAGPGAGFTAGTPWLPLAADFADMNVEQARRDRRSLLTLYRRLIAWRREQPALVVGGYEALAADGDLLAYRRSAQGHFVVVLNFGGAMQEWTCPREVEGMRIVMSTELDREGEHVGRLLPLRPDEGVLLSASAAASGPEPRPLVR